VVVVIPQEVAVVKPQSVKEYLPTVQESRVKVVQWGVVKGVVDQVVLMVKLEMVFAGNEEKKLLSET
jgi:hypothetical protein